MNFNRVGNAGVITRAASVLLLVSLALTILPGRANAATVVTFTTVGTTSWTAPDGVTSVDYLVVAGGGGGGRTNGGGGGAGGMRTGTLSVTPGNAYTVTVGAGGLGSNVSPNGDVNGTNGGNSVFGSVTATGGGGGGRAGVGSAGGSGGGAGQDNTGYSGGAGTAGQGFRGGNTPAGPGTPFGGAGGGGAGGQGVDAGGATATAGGPGSASSITGASVTYAGGGGGGTTSGTAGAGGTGGGGTGGVGGATPTSGTNGLGGGGGGGASGIGGNGGSGIVIISYTPPFDGLTITKNSTVTGDASVIGTLSKGAGTFVIDHPLDPKNKLLYHSFVESPDVKNIYDGIATLDKNGEAVIELPRYFLALNKDFRYLGTAIGQPMPDLFLSKEVRRRFFGLFGKPVIKISGGAPNGRVSWQVTGIRKDPLIVAHPIVVEVEKGPGQLVEKGKYLFPELYESE